MLNETSQRKTFFVCVLKTFEYNTVLSTILTMFCTRFFDLSHFVAASLYPFTNLSHLPTPGNYFSTLCFSDLLIEIEWWLPGARGNRKMLIKGHKLQFYVLGISCMAR